ncbi:MAG TPA: polysaccharide deacetylase family protein [Gemmatimonadales bacterium]|jgi:peptidoglycan/xylan/chitin deacetylase (PgdA/CDA1 family)|nr:polysaccharide deacetylase family protein [Gemmatimonadales bacterium]
MAPKPLASVSLDADDLWSYLKTHGDPGWAERPSYLPAFFPLVLELLDRLELRITFFLVGYDAARPANRAVLAEVVRRGHEVGNHSFEHECWLHRYDRDRLDRELARAEEAIEAATGVRPRGFRGPGFSWSPLLLDVLERRGYRYDASTLPTFIGPLARWYFLKTARLSAAERREREALFGAFTEGFRRNKPYRWRLDGGRSLLEIPVTTVPGLRVPFHLSYLLYLSRVAPRLAELYLHGAARACRLTNTPPSFLLHPLDVLGREDVPALAFFPGMDLPGEVKRRFFARALGLLREYFELGPLGPQVEALERDGGLPLKEARG